MSSGWVRARTAIGWAGLQWRTGAADDWSIVGLSLPPLPRALPLLGHTAAEELLVGLVAGAAQPAAVWRRIDRTGWSDFTSRVRQTLTEQVPAGRVISYGGLAELVGSPGGARAVAAAMRSNPVPLLCPCHRVVAAGGRLGGFQGRDPAGPARKRRLLEYEGIRFVAGRVATEQLIA